ncbi:MAG: CPBP family intramembrane metalloprotease [Spirochaetales bacterium]|nr:CPBP family intramembrane metalloprotease [Leptospiraceae bacterium]MCP5483857.1 CPBP family intramembrane metalloprotease [Spirochaetales bacterium]MCP5486850.1 CPBP family intramembrane metalloprotease [Spirochaetales bacterium]
MLLRTGLVALWAIALCAGFLATKFIVEFALRMGSDPVEILYQQHYKLILSASYIGPLFFVCLFFRRTEAVQLMLLPPADLAGETDRITYRVSLRRALEAALRVSPGLLALLCALPLGLIGVGQQLHAIALVLFPVDRLLRASLELMWPRHHWLDLLGAFVTPGIVAPIVEELVFRGLMLGLAARYFFAVPGLRARLLLYGSVVFQSALYALSHLNPWEAAPLFLFGIVLAILRLRTGSILLPIAIHALLNMLSVAQIYFWPEMPYFGGDALTTALLPWYIFLPCLALVVLPLYGLTTHKPGLAEEAA